MTEKRTRIDSLRSDKTPYQRPHDKTQEVVVHANADTHQVVVRRAPSLRWRRGMFTLSITALTFGVLMILFSKPSIRNEVFAPGGLCSAHARILAEQGTDRCSACHPAAHQSLAGWVSTAVWGPPENMPTQSALCLNCHSQSLGEDFAMNPHGVSPASLERLTEATPAATEALLPAKLDLISRLPSPVYDGQLACSACHREHQGGQSNLTSLTDGQCQGCHQNEFYSFEKGHPEFRKYPTKRRSQIAFDHASHFGKHFPASKKDFACAQCHTSDDGNVVQTVVPFEQACADCHQQGIAASADDGLALIALPTLDVDAIQKQQASIGSWPLAATGDFDGPLPPLMRILLTADAQAAKVLNAKDDQFDFSDIDPDNASDVADGVTLVWAIKRLVFEMARDGEASIARRFQVVTGRDLDARQLSELVQTLDTHALRNAAMRWLPDLQMEVGEQVPFYDASFELQKEFELQLARSRQSFHLGSRDELALAKIINEFAQNQNEQNEQLEKVDGSEWLAINPLKGLGSNAETNASGVETQIVGRGANTMPSPVEQTRASSIPQSRQKRDSQKPGPEPAAIANPRIQQGSLAGSQWLAENPLGQKSPTGDEPNEVLQPESSEKSTGPTGGSPRGGDDVQPPGRLVWQTELPPVEEGWLRDDLTFQLRYQPTGHADPVLQAWIDFVAGLPAAASSPALQPAFEGLVSIEAIGDCRRCHTADRQADQSLAVNWKAEYRDPAIAAFTKFSHGPHLTLPQLRDCSQCHQLETDRRTADAYLSHDPGQAASNFAPMKVADCATCHRTGSVSNRCTQCHNYHVGQRSMGDH
jgi:hypothetical protein